MSRETCLGCPIEECHVEVDGLCNRCDDIEDWLADHDKQIRDEVISEIENFVNGLCEYPPTSLLGKKEMLDKLKRMKGEKNE